jgi:hypothetical protein
MSSQNDVKNALEAVLREAREDLGTTVHGVRWESVEEKLFLRVASEKRVTRNLEAHDGSQRTWQGIGALAAAAALLLVFGHRGEQSRPMSDAQDNPHQGKSAGALASHDGRGDITSTRRTSGPSGERTRSEVVEMGRPLAVGGRIETNDARGVFVTERGAASTASGPAVTWALETQTRVDVVRDGSPLILGLLSGAIEAQVAPVDQGEAFAIDVEGVRIAVHGTHLRVARVGGSTKVIVDLSEGVVSIGLPPRTGSTYGTLVTAPAHVEFDAADLAKTIHVDHATASVRSPVVLTPAPSREEPRAAFEPRQPRDNEPTSQPNSQTEKSSATHIDPVISPGHGDVPASRVDAEKAVLAGVKACALGGLRAASVKVTVSSKLTLEIGPEGSVQSARFDPPLAPEARECATRVIYGAKFEGPRTVEIPIEIEP